jgi:hypothetical protein
MSCGYFVGAVGVCIGVASGLFNKIQFPEEFTITDDTINEFGQHQWVNGFIYGISSTLLMSSFCFGRMRAIKTA